MRVYIPFIVLLMASCAGQDRVSDQDPSPDPSSTAFLNGEMTELDFFCQPRGRDGLLKRIEKYWRFSPSILEAAKTVQNASDYSPYKAVSACYKAANITIGVLGKDTDIPFLMNQIISSKSLSPEPKAAKKQRQLQLGSVQAIAAILGKARLRGLKMTNNHVDGEQMIVDCMKKTVCSDSTWDQSMTHMLQDFTITAMGLAGTDRLMNELNRIEGNLDPSIDPYARYTNYSVSKARKLKEQIDDNALSILEYINKVEH